MLSRSMFLCLAAPLVLGDYDNDGDNNSIYMDDPVEGEGGEQNFGDMPWLDKPVWFRQLNTLGPLDQTMSYLPYRLVLRNGIVTIFKETPDNKHGEFKHLYVLDDMCNVMPVNYATPMANDVTRGVRVTHSKMPDIYFHGQTDEDSSAMLSAFQKTMESLETQASPTQLALHERWGPPTTVYFTAVPVQSWYEPDSIKDSSIHQDSLRRVEEMSQWMGGHLNDQQYYVAVAPMRGSVMTAYYVTSAMRQNQAINGLTTMHVHWNCQSNSVWRWYWDWKHNWANNAQKLCRALPLTKDARTPICDDLTQNYNFETSNNRLMNSRGLSEMNVFLEELYANSMGKAMLVFSRGERLVEMLRNNNVEPFDDSVLRVVHTLERQEGGMRSAQVVRFSLKFSSFGTAKIDSAELVFSPN